MPSQAERRKHQRLDYTINVSGPDGRLGLAKNMSIDGCFIETKKSIDNTFCISYGLNKRLKVVNMKCRVIWKNNFGIGTKFSLDDENKKILSQGLFIKNVEEKGIRIY